MILEITCPQCGSGSITGDNDFGYTCNECDWKFYLEDLD